VTLLGGGNSSEGKQNLVIAQTNLLGIKPSLAMKKGKSRGKKQEKHRPDIFKFELVLRFCFRGGGQGPGKGKEKIHKKRGSFKRNFVGGEA